MEFGFNTFENRTDAFIAFLEIETTFHLIYYNSSFDTRFGNFKSLKLQPQLITSFFKIVTFWSIPICFLKKDRLGHIK